MLLFAKNFLHSAAIKSSRNPIEMIVFCLIIASFSYASLFRSLMESEFFNTESYQKIDPIKVISYSNSNEFVNIGKRDFANIHATRLLDSIMRFKEIIENEVFVTDGKSKFYYNDDLCYKSNEDKNFDNLSITVVLNYVFNTNMNNLADAWEDKVAKLNFEKIFAFNGKRQISHAEKGSFAWLAFVIGSLFMNIQDLIQVC
ncbi:7740_t:CDS:2 [Diversispora eburnea]|uniref:7740_t:CDS:1 n=1 Tax=Diversispora eburnea TaxID=1213867 RepID=A0A9N8WDU7_9GLOM|nr:7740_t:CDS:2 [Diversispora eburnea]